MVEAAKMEEEAVETRAEPAEARPSVKLPVMPASGSKRACPGCGRASETAPRPASGLRAFALSASVRITFTALVVAALV
jgi:hypothetical protein